MQSPRFAGILRCLLLGFTLGIVGLIFTMPGVLSPSTLQSPAVASSPSPDSTRHEPTLRPSSMRTAAAQNVTEVIDGATHPELIPDDRAYHLVLMLASARPDEPVEARARADAVLNAILRGYKADTVPLAEIANRHADTYRRAAAELGAAIDERAFEQQRRDLVIESRRQIAARLSPLSAIALQFYVDREKRGMKMHRLPDMPPALGGRPTQTRHSVAPRST